MKSGELYDILIQNESVHLDRELVNLLEKFQKNGKELFLLTEK